MSIVTLLGAGETWGQSLGLPDLSFVVEASACTVTTTAGTAYSGGAFTLNSSVVLCHNWCSSN